MADQAARLNGDESRKATAFVELEEDANNSEIYSKCAWQMGTLDLVYVRVTLWAVLIFTITSYNLFLSINKGSVKKQNKKIEQNFQC